MYDLGTACGSFLLVGKAQFCGQEIQRKAGKVMLCNEEMRKSILSRLQGYRYEHSLGVERAAIMLAEKYGEDPEKAGTAGILHD